MSEKKNDTFDGLNEQQREAVEHDQGPLLLLAGAGSGKTRVVILRIIRLIEKGVNPHSILGVTFTNKAAGEMRHRISTATSFDVLLSTFHSLGARLLRESIHHLGYRRDFTIYDEEDVEKVIKACIDELGWACERADVKNLRQMISKAKNALQDPDNVNLPGVRGLFAERMPILYRAYRDKLFQYNALDFDDLLYLPVRLFREHSEVLAYYQNRWQYLLIDEYQDTNVAQYQFIQLLVQKSRNLCVVGDPDQSIYSWRGAEIRNILDFQKDYPDAKIVRLEQNYRSTSNILDAANAVISRNESRYEKNLWSDLGPGEKIGLYTGQDENEESRFVAECIRYHRDKHGIPANRMVVFYRTNFQSRAFEDRFLSMRIPYVIVGGVSFYQRREIKDVMSYLRIVNSSTDMVSFERTVNMPKRGLGETSVDKIRSGAQIEGLPIFDFCRGLVDGTFTHPPLSPKQRNALKGYVDLIEGLRRLRDQVSLTDLVKAAMNLSGYLGFLQQDQETYDDRASNLEELVTKANEWEETNPGGQLTNFLEELSLKASIDEVDPSEPRVNLMTLHSGKGLEFPVAFLVGMEEDLFPHVNSRDNPSQLEEERRLCYVGITRAQRFLYVSRVRSRHLWGGRRSMYGSRFLSEIPREYSRAVREPLSGDDSEEVVEERKERIVYDDAEQAYERPKPSSDFVEGDMVFHREFGIGRVDEIYEGGAGLMYKVFFVKDQKTRNLVASLASLSKLK
ncbi:MAG: UvrD-helicase domain-containing protein [Chlamydiales bacterium]|nr:UvrD-helicase domain-containing protein [Chlamydiales bacterium]